MKLFKLSFLLSKSLLDARHKKYIFFATIILCLEYLDLIIYIKNTRMLADLYLINSISRIEGVLLLFFILLGANFLAKLLINRSLSTIHRKISNANLVIISCLVISVAFLLQALTIIYYCNTLMISVLVLLLISRVIYQFSLGIIIHDTYEFLVNTKELRNEFIYLILNSLELSVFIGIISYKILPFFELSKSHGLAALIIVLSLLWLLTAVIFFINRKELNQYETGRVRSSTLNNVRLMLRTEINDTIIAFSVVGVRSSLCIIGVIYMPVYLIGSLHFLAKSANNIIALSSLFALTLCIVVDRHLHRFNYINTLKSGLVGLIIGCLVSYLLFFFKIIPFVGVAILIVFHSLFALVCPQILSKLFSTNIRQVAIISCYRNSFLIFASFTFILLNVFTEILHNYIFPPAVFLIVITVICYLSLTVFNKKVIS